MEELQGINGLQGAQYIQFVSDRLDRLLSQSIINVDKIRNEPLQLLELHLQEQQDTQPSYQVTYLYAKLLYYTEQFEKSQQEFQKSLIIDPTQAEPHFFLALMQLDNSQFYRKEITGFKKLENHPVYGQLALIRQALAQEFMKKSEDYFTQAKNKSRDGTLIYTQSFMLKHMTLPQYCHVLFSFNQQKEAKNMLKHALQFKLAKKEEILYEFGHYYYLKDKFDKAINFFEQAYNENPQYQRAMFKLAVAYNFSKRINESIDLFKEILKIYPVFFSGYINQGYNYMQLAERRKALNHFEVCLQLDPEESDIYDNIGTLYKQMGDLGECLKNYQKSLQIKPNCSATLNNIGLVNLQHNNDQEAEFYFKKSIQVDEKFVPGHNNLAVIFNKKKQFANAMEQFNIILKINPELREYHIKKADILLIQKQRKEAVFQYIEGVKNNVDNLKLIKNRQIRDHVEKISRIDQILRNSQNKLVLQLRLLKDTKFYKEYFRREICWELSDYLQLDSHYYVRKKSNKSIFKQKTE